MDVAMLEAGPPVMVRPGGHADRRWMAVMESGRADAGAAAWIFEGVEMDRAEGAAPSHVDPHHWRAGLSEADVSALTSGGAPLGEVDRDALLATMLGEADGAPADEVPEWREALGEESAADLLRRDEHDGEPHWRTSLRESAGAGVVDALLGGADRRASR